LRKTARLADGIDQFVCTVYNYMALKVNNCKLHINLLLPFWYLDCVIFYEYVQIMDFITLYIKMANKPGTSFMLQKQILIYIGSQLYLHTIYLFVFMK